MMFGSARSIMSVAAARYVGVVRNVTIAAPASTAATQSATTMRRRTMMCQ
jgi:hypothetical protein